MPSDDRATGRDDAWTGAAGQQGSVRGHGLREDLRGLIEGDEDREMRTGLRVSPDDAIASGGDRRPSKPEQGAEPAAAAAAAAAPDGEREQSAGPFDERAFAEENDALARQLSRRNRVLPLVIALTALTGFAVVVWYAYSWGVGDVDPADLPVVAAEDGPEKIRPEDPGGLKVPHQDKLVMNETEGESAAPRVERLLPPPEQPIEIARPDPAPAAPETADAAAAAPAGEDIATPPPPPPLVSSSVPATAAPAPEGPATAAPAPATRSSGEPPTAPAVAVLESQSGSASAAAEAPAAPAEPEPVQQAAVPAPTGAGALFNVQVASLKSREAAETAWARIAKAQAEVLADKSPTFERVDLGERGVFIRVQAGPYESREAAAAACGRLKARQQDCLVVQREP